MFTRNHAALSLLVMSVVVCLFGAARAAGQGGPSVQRPAEPVILASTVYTSNQGPRSLSVWRRDLESTPAATLQYLKKHPERNSLPNVVLYAVDTPFGSQAAGRVVWAGYDYFASNLRPWPSWSAGVVVHPITKRIYLTVMKTMSLRATLSLFEIAGDAAIAPYPPDFTVAGVDQWPDPPRPSATMQRDTPAEACAPTSIGMVPTASGLMMAVVREPGGCTSLFLEYETTSKAWRDVTMAPSR